MIHKYKLNDLYLVLDVNSGAVHHVDACAFALLDLMEAEATIEKEMPKTYVQKITDFSIEELQETYDELYKVCEKGLLFSMESEKPKLDVSNSPVKALCLHIAHDCNLRCKYCFADSGEYHQKREMMSAEVGKRAIDFLIENSGSRRNLEIDFFGGEPLMNFEVVKEIVEYTKTFEEKYPKNFRFTITTNGILLDDAKLDYINKHMGNIVLSIDGRKEINDRMRFRVDGSGCYDSIMPKFKKVAESRNQQGYYVRGTFTKWNKDFDKDVMHFVEEGFEQISVEPVASGSEMAYSISEEDLPEIFESYERLAENILQSKQNNQFFNFFHYMIDLTGGPCIIKRVMGCGAGNEYLAIAPNGDLYPCHQFVGKTEFLMGNVATGKLNQSIKREFADLNVYTKEGCSDCWAKYFCSGGCNANSFLYGGGLKKPYKIGCELEKKRVECALMIKVAENLINSKNS